MGKSYRIRSTPGIDKNIRVQIDQDFDFLEILSLKLRNEDVYTRFCADYGVVAGRVVANGGFGIPNVNVSIFVPLSVEDESDIVISTLYPYKDVTTKNEDGYRYNLLPYKKEYGGHSPTGTFPDREDILTRKEVLEVYKKYYKFTVKTNNSGDFMIIGVPLGMQKIILDLDLSNIGTFSLRPTDLIRMGLGTESQFDGEQFKTSVDLDSLPQILHLRSEIEVESFWGEKEICNIGISRIDFDLRDFGGIDIKPQAIFLGSLFSTDDKDFLKTNCKPKFDSGNLCDLVTGEGTIFAVRQTIDTDSDGRPILEQYILPQGGKIIDSDGVWMVEIPMNLEYMTTNEFGEMVISNDPNIGIPTKGKYRFRVRYQNEDGIKNPIYRADYLVPNIKEWGWTDSITPPPSQLSPSSANDKTYQQLNSYGFGISWEDYGDPNTTIGLNMINEAIDAKDRFYEFNFNKVYTISMFLDRWKWGFNRSQHLGIKEITDRSCTTTTNRFPTNDGVRNFDFLYFIFSVLLTILTPVVIILLIIAHVLALIYPIVRTIVNFVINVVTKLYPILCDIGHVKLLGWYPFKGLKKYCNKKPPEGLPSENPFMRLPIPMMSFPDCEACDCQTEPLEEVESPTSASLNQQMSVANLSILADINSFESYNTLGYNRIPQNSLAALDNDTINDKWKTLFSGSYLKVFAYKNLFKVPLITFDTFGFVNPNSGNNIFIGSDVTLSQSMNLANLRSRYFSQDNIIKTTISNVGSNPSDPFTDSILILLCDPDVINSLPAKSLLTFNDPANINDPNFSGASAINQFNTNSITGSTPFSSNNIQNFTSKSVKYIDTDGNEQISNIYLNISENGKAYKYKSGIEYFQVITGLTISDLKTMVNGVNVGLLNQYLLNKTQTQRDFEYIGGGVSFLNSIYNEHSWVSLNQIPNSNLMGVMFLTRGVDVYTQKQTISYDLSKLFGYSLGSNTVSVSGEYFLNIPIQKNTGTLFSPQNWWTNYMTPESHNIVNNTNVSLYHEPFGFSADSSQFSAFTNNSPKYYNSSDKSTSSFKVFNNDDDDIEMGFEFGVNYLGPDMLHSYLANRPQGIYEGGSLIKFKYGYPSGANQSNDNIGEKKKKSRVYSPAYLYSNSINTVITDSNKLVFRSDRLPISDKIEKYGNNIYSLHLNNNFGYYLINDSGVGISLPSLGMGATDSNNNIQNLTGDTPSAITDKVINSLTCGGLVPLSCYEGSGTNFTINDTNCTDNKIGKNGANKRVVGGCYYFVDNTLIVSIGKDIKAFAEWRARFRLIFGACRGVISEVFQNNWVNGTLYMFSFKKRAVVSILGQVKKYKFCGSKFDSYRTGQGPIIYTEGTTNSFFYRCTPYNSNTDNFVGQQPLYNGNNAVDKYKGMNTSNIFFPTTIMDLGPRDKFTKEISTNPIFEGYYIDKLKSTSYNESSDIVNLFIISRLINSNFGSRMIGAGDASMGQLFSRSEDRIDGDIAQLFSINSEFGVEGFGDDFYDDNDIWISSNGDPILGLFFTSSTVNRVIVSPGVVTFTPTLSNYFGYQKTQEVPFYKWKLNDTNSIFGNEKNEWNSNTPFYSQKYQSLSFIHPPISEYFNIQSNNGKRGFIYNSDPSTGYGVSNWPQSQSQSFLVGAPYHFYFGLYKGKSAINRYITKYILNKDE